MGHITFLWGAVLLLASSAVAADGPLTCVNELAVPGYRGIVSGLIPAVVNVRVLIGKDGHAASVEYGEGQERFRIELDEYFKDKTKYSNDCQGTTITFTVRYQVGGKPIDYKPTWETRIRPPNEIVLICHPLGVALDPAPQIEIQPKGKTRK